MKANECEDCKRILETDDLEKLSVCDECGHLWNVFTQVKCSCEEKDG